MSGFRDDFDRKAHDVICLVKYGSTGGSVSTSDMKRVGDYLRGGPFVVPTLPRPVVVPTLPRPVVVPPIPMRVV